MIDRTPTKPPLYQELNKINFVASKNRRTSYFFKSNKTESITDRKQNSILTLTQRRKIFLQTLFNKNRIRGKEYSNLQLLPFWSPKLFTSVYGEIKVRLTCYYAVTQWLHFQLHLPELTPYKVVHRRTNLIGNGDWVERSQSRNDTEICPRGRYGICAQILQIHDIYSWHMV